jgi:hypothetical protein
MTNEARAQDERWEGPLVDGAVFPRSQEQLSAICASAQRSAVRRGYVRVPEGAEEPIEQIPPADLPVRSDGEE